MLSVRLRQAENRQILAEGRLLDLRKRGIVPRLGTIQGPSVVHDLTTQVRLDDERRIHGIETAMREFPFCPAPETGGEGCPDRLDDLQQLIGLRLDHDYGAAVTERVGGPRGCFHVLTLLRLLGPTVRWALSRPDRTAARNGTARDQSGSPIFARSLVVDGLVEDNLQLTVHAVLLDILFAPGADRLPLEQELEAGLEIAVRMTVSLPDLTATALSGRRRQSGPGVTRVGAWEPLDTLDRLAGTPLRKGYAAAVQASLADADGIDPLTLLLIVLAPVVMQCMPSLFDLLEVRPRRVDVARAATDSCHMWRANGPLASLGHAAAPATARRSAP